MKRTSFTFRLFVRLLPALALAAHGAVDRWRSGWTMAGVVTLLSSVAHAAVDVVLPLRRATCAGAFMLLARAGGHHQQLPRWRVQLRRVVAGQ
jgi:hypothetical protein